MPDAVEILIVEDSDAKLTSVQSAISGQVPTASISSAKSVKSALNLLRAKQFSLIVADMSLPTYDVKSRERGGTARPFGGIEIFDFLQRKHSATPVVVVSSYPAIVDGSKSLTLPALGAELRASYPTTFRGYVFFDSAYLTWERELQTLVEEIIYGESTT